MGPFDNTPQSFVVKFWLESGARRSPRWSGFVAHVPSGARAYIRRLDDIIDFIVPYLVEGNARVGLYWQVRHWFRTQLRRLRSAHDDSSGV